MTIYTKHKNVNGYRIRMGQDKDTAFYTVSAVKDFGHGLFSHTLISNSYMTEEQALNRFYKLTARAKKNSL